MRLTIPSNKYLPLGIQAMQKFTQDNIEICFTLHPKKNLY